MPFGHLFVDAPPEAVLAAMDAHFRSLGFSRAAMRPELHPRRMKQVHENDVRLFWLSPRLGRWTGLFEFRYYDNENRERWGLTDEVLAAALSKSLTAPVWRLEVVDNAGFWLWNRFENGAEAEGGAYQDTAASRSTDPGHPRYALNRIIDREGFRNIGLGYEHVPGPQVRALDNVPHDPRGIEGLEGFVHAAWSREPLKPLP